MNLKNWSLALLAASCLPMSVAAQSAAQLDTVMAALANGKFSVEIAGKALTGGGVTALIEWREAGNDAAVRYRPGNNKTVRLVRGWDPGQKQVDALYQWGQQAVVDGAAETKSVSLVILNDDGVAIGEVDLGGCLATAWGVDKNSAHAVETLKIVYENMDYKPR